MYKQPKLGVSQIFDGIGWVKILLYLIYANNAISNNQKIININHDEYILAIVIIRR